MGQEIIFAVDKRLCVRSWGDDISELKGEKKPAVLGKRYYTREILKSYDGSTEMTSKKRLWDSRQIISACSGEEED
jgi:hypothetical protein